MARIWWSFGGIFRFPRSPCHDNLFLLRRESLASLLPVSTQQSVEPLIDPPATLDVMPPQGTVHRKAVPLQCPPTSNIAHKDCCVHPNSVQIPEAKVASEAIQRGKQGLLEPVLPERPMTTSPLERAIKELRRRIRPMDGFGSQAGATNFLRAWMIKENVRSQGQDWLEAFMA